MLGYAGARAAARVGTVVARYAFGEHIESGTLVDRTEIVGEKDPDRRVHPDYRDVRPLEGRTVTQRRLDRRPRRRRELDAEVNNGLLPRDG